MKHIQLNVCNPNYIRSGQEEEVQYEYYGNLEETKTQVSTTLIVNGWNLS